MDNKRNFFIGERIRCIDIGPGDNGLEHNKIYICMNINGIFVYIKNDKLERPHGYFKDRFESAEREMLFKEILESE